MVRCQSGFAWVCALAQERVSATHDGHFFFDLMTSLRGSNSIKLLALILKIRARKVIFVPAYVLDGMGGT